MINLQALILCAGQGKRMKPLVTDKILLPMLGKPLISFIVEDLKKAGVKNFIIVANEKNLPQLKNYFNGKEFTFYLQKETKGMASAVMSVKTFNNLPLLVLNGDDLFSPSFLKDFLSSIKDNDQVLLAGMERKTYFPGGYFVMKNKDIKAIIEKPKEGNEPSPFLKLVVDYFKNPSILLEKLTHIVSQKDDLYEKALNAIIKEKRVRLFPYQKSWAAIKFPWQILDFQNLVLKERLKKSLAKDAEIFKNVTIRGTVAIEEKVKIFEGAVIVGPTYIGKNTVIGNHSLIRESIIADNCLIGASTEIARSFIGPECWLHRNYLGDSVLEKDIRFGAGALTANFRLDSKKIDFKVENENLATGKEKLGAIIAQGARIGVNASLMPGISVAENAWVGPGAVVKNPLNPGEKVKK